MNLFKKYINWRVLGMAIIFGLIGGLTLKVGMRVPIFPEQDVAADAREIFVLMGAALTGPLGGMIAGAITGWFSPYTEQNWYTGTLIAHAFSGLFFGLFYAIFYPRMRSIGRFIPLWIINILLYYTIIVVVFGLFTPELIETLANGQSTLIGFLRLFQGALPEAAFMLVFTGAAMLALPGRYRVPLWVRSNVDKTHGGV